MNAYRNFARNGRAVFSVAALSIFVACSGALGQSDPLPSWNDTTAKRAIVEFVTDTTKEGSRTFVPPAERIATFDQDGTLWVEHPMYSQVIYCLDRVPALVAEKPELRNVEPFKTVLTGDQEAIAKLPMPDLEKLLAATLTGMTVDEFQAEVEKWISSAKDPRWVKPYTELTYQPMKEVLVYLRANGYKTYIVTGGGQDFVRVYSGSDLWHPAGAGRRNGRQHDLQLWQGRQTDPDQGAQAPSQRQRCRQAGGHSSDDRTPAGFCGGELDRRPADARIY